MSSGHNIPAKGEPAPDEILRALREAIFENPRLRELPSEEAARQLVLDGCLQTSLRPCWWRTCCKPSRPRRASSRTENSPRRATRGERGAWVDEGLEKGGAVRRGRNRAMLLHNGSSLSFLNLALGRNCGGGVRIRVAERGDRTALEQIEKLTGVGRLDVHRLTHPPFELHHEPRELRNLGPVQDGPLS